MPNIKEPQKENGGEVKFPITTAKLSIKDLFAQNNVKKKFKELMGEKMQGFITSILQYI